MSVVEQTCYLLKCDGCGVGDDGGDFIPHWDSASEARKEVDPDSESWLLNFDGKDYCYRCRRDVVHEHKWDDGVCEICDTFEPEPEDAIEGLKS